MPSNSAILSLDMSGEEAISFNIVPLFPVVSLGVVLPSILGVVS